MPQSWGGSYAYLFGGTSAGRWGSLELPLDLTPFGAPGCHLYTGLEWMWPVIRPSAKGMAAAVDIPDDARLIGAKLYLQAVVLGIPYNALGISTSQAIEATIGPRPAYDMTMVGPLERPRLVVDPFGNRLPGLAPVIQLIR